MNEQQAIDKMVMPSQRRPGKPLGGVIQIHVTRNCDKSCYGCTQGSNLRGNDGYIALDLFERAVISLKDYFGVVGVFGGNPALHPQFPELCEILRLHIPKSRCGLWCNKPFGHAPVMRKTFNPAVSNLNVHLDQDAYREFRNGWPECNPFGLKDDSRHSPVYVSMRDVIPEEERRWDLIANCDINKHWSAMVAVFRGELRAWFCEIAGAQSILHQHEEDYPDTGLALGPYVKASPEKYWWWQLYREEFSNQINHHCHRCGVPLKGHGNLAQGSTGFEQVSQDHASIYQPKTKGREVEVVTELVQLGTTLPKFTHYMQNAKR